MLPPPRKTWTGQFATHPCPVCNGKVYDNTKEKRNPKAPDFKCAECGHPEWKPNAAR